MDKCQKKAITNSYVPLCEKSNLQGASIPKRVKPLKIEDVRRNEILKELEESQAETIILLGDEPIRCFLACVSDCKKKRLAEFGENTETYGLEHSVSINGKTYKVRPLTHPGNFIHHLKKWEQLHRNWVEKMNSRK
jgi:hypothetical protein